MYEFVLRHEAVYVDEKGTQHGELYFRRVRLTHKPSEGDRVFVKPCGICYMVVGVAQVHEEFDPVIYTRREVKVSYPAFNAHCRRVADEGFAIAPEGKVR